MYHKTSIFLFLFLLFVGFSTMHEAAHAEQSQSVECTINTPDCVLERVLADIQTIDNQEWKDESTHDAAHQYARLLQFDNAIKLIAGISSDDLKAKTIKSVGMLVKGNIAEKTERTRIFTALHVEAKKITNPTAYTTALKNVAISEAYSGDHEEALKKVGSIDNQGFRNKAYADVAEIEAMHGTWALAKQSLEHIDNHAVKNKAYETVVKTLTDRGLKDNAYDAALMISNSYQKSKAILYILSSQQPPAKESGVK